MFETILSDFRESYNIVSYYKQEIFHDCEANRLSKVKEFQDDLSKTYIIEFFFNKDLITKG